MSRSIISWAMEGAERAVFESGGVRQSDMSRVDQSSSVFRATRRRCDVFTSLLRQVCSESSHIWILHPLCARRSKIH